MPDETKELESAGYLTQAIDLLDKNQFSGFLEQMAALGEWLQKKHNLPHYKGHKAALAQAVATLQTPLAIRSLRQTLAFEVLQNAWQDSGLARMQALHFVDHENVPGEANTCQLLQQPEEPYWLLIPVNANGVKQPCLDLRTLDKTEDALALLEQKRNGVEIDLARLQRALRRATLPTLDQRSLGAKADLSKDTRHRIKLGLEAFKLLYPEAKHEAEAEAEILPQLVLLDEEPTPEAFARYPANTYIVLYPRRGRKGRVWFLQEKGKKQQLQQGFSLGKILRGLLNEVVDSSKTAFSADLLQALDEEQLLLLSENEIIRKRAKTAFDNKIRCLLLDAYFRHLDAKAVKAIRHYKTTRQKILHLFEKTVAALAALAYGGVSLIATMVGLFVATGIVWSNPGLAIAGVLLLAAAVILPVPTTWANWKLFSTYLPAFFDKIGAEYREINTPKKKALFWGLSLLALATGIASGGLTYTATIALPAMMGLGAIGFIFPPLGVAFAAAVALSQAVTFIRNFCDILRKENSWQSFKKPFADVSKILRNNNASFGQRLATWILVGGLTLLSALGLVMSCFTSTRSVGKFFIDQFRTAPEKALICGIAISAVASFLSRIYFTLSSGFSFASQVCKRLFQHEPGRISLKKGIGVITDSISSAAFYAWSMIHLAQKTPEEFTQDIDLHISGLGTVPTALLATGALLTSGTRALAINVNHAGKPSDPYAEARQKAAIQRVNKGQEYYLKKNPHGVFACAKQKAEEQTTPCYEAFSSATLTRT